MRQLLLLTSIFFSLISYTRTYADNGHFHPDSLQNITISGITVIDSSMMHPMYYLDTDGDKQADYYLNFGPYWYQPDSSKAVRPVAGQEITIDGGVNDSENDILQTIVVYDIDGVFWRNPAEPSWNMMGGHQNEMGHHNGMGYAFGWMHDSLHTAELTGIIITDSTFINMIYYLDVNSDSLPDYYLNFGPPWFEPQNGIQRPSEGETVQITGGLLNNHNIPMFIVYSLNGQTWRDSSTIGNHFGGGWMTNNMVEGRYFYSPFDTLDGMFVYPGWQAGMGHGHDGMMSDSLFCQILEVFPQNIPNRAEEHVLAGYEIGMFNPDGSNNMWTDGMNGGHMNMSSNVDYTLHYSDIQVAGERISESTIEVKYWDNWNNNWVTVYDAQLDQFNNTITFSSREVSNYVILSGQQSVTALDNPESLIANGFLLEQNYPNPFNPVTVIGYQLAESGRVKLSVYNALGQKVALLVDANMTAGEHQVEFNSGTLPSGTYYYELKVGSQSSVGKMILLK